MSERERLLDQVLILRWQVGDERAFVRLVEQYQGSLRYFIRRLLGDPQEAEDVLQDVWLAVIRNIRRLRNLDAFSVWVYRIARNKVYEQLRRSNQLPKFSEQMAEVEAEQDDEAFSPDEAASVHAALAALRPEHREVLVLRFLRQMSYLEVAAVVGCGSGTVKSRIHYAMRALRREMEVLSDDTPE